MTTKAVDALAAMPPRQMQQALREAIGMALYDGRQRVLERDVPGEAWEVERKPRMGFLP